MLEKIKHINKAWASKLNNKEFWGPVFIGISGTFLTNPNSLPGYLWNLIFGSIFILLGIAVTPLNDLKLWSRLFIVGGFISFVTGLRIRPDDFWLWWVILGLILILPLGLGFLIKDK